MQVLEQIDTCKQRAHSYKTSKHHMRGSTDEISLFGQCNYVVLVP